MPQNSESGLGISLGTKSGRANSGAPCSALAKRSDWSSLAFWKRCTRKIAKGSARPWRVHWSAEVIMKRNTASCCRTDGCVGLPRRVGLIATAEANRFLVRGVSRDITARKLAEEEANQRRNEVAHLARVTTLGEISGSLAHELNQPLGAILVNTEAAELHLQRPTPKLDEVRAILKDIRTDDLRASEIIHGMRAFLQRREWKCNRSKLDRSRKKPSS